MTEWWSYSLSDFLMFSPRTYWRLVDQYNRDVWPLHLGALGIGLMCAWLASKGSRWAYGLLALAWAWVGWAFHWERLATIYLAAPWFAGAFALQAMLLLALAWKNPKLAMGRARWFVVAVAVVAYPLSSLAFGRPLTQSESFGLMPDPTALLTLALLAGRKTWFAAFVPAASLLAGIALHAAMLQ
jgi:hypothetical protein